MARILLIEDSPTEAAVMTQLLERNGHMVTTSGNAEDGIASCKRDKPDLVLMDVVLPGMNGRELMDRLTEEHPGVKCMFISGYTADIIGNRGVDDDVRLLQKPFSLVDLAATVRDVLDGG